MFRLVSGRHVGVTQTSSNMASPYYNTIIFTIIFRDTFYRITRNITHPRYFGTVFIYYSSTICQFLDSIYSMVSDFIFHLRDNEAYLHDVKTKNCLPPICPAPDTNPTHLPTPANHFTVLRSRSFYLSITS